MYLDICSVNYVESKYILMFGQVHFMIFDHHWALQPSVKIFLSNSRITALWLLCLTGGDQIAAKAPHKYSLRIKAHSCTKCVIAFSKPTYFSMSRQIHKTAYIGFQLQGMLEEFKPEISTHSPICHHGQRAMQPSVKMFCVQKTHHCTFCSK